MIHKSVWKVIVGVKREKNNLKNNIYNIIGYTDYNKFKLNEKV